MPVSLPYLVYDADNHLYESETAMTAHLPRKWRKEFCYVDVGGRTKLAIGGTISEYVPNPTFEVLAAPGTHEPGYRGSLSPGDPAFDPFWARVQEAGIFVSFHASDSGYDRYVRMWEGGRGEFLGFVHTPMKTCVAVLDRAISDTMAALICHGVFDRFPRVRVACIENGSRWVRSLFERFELAFGQQPKEFARHPIETFRRHVWVSPFYEEPIDDLARLIGADHVLFGSDYPHPEGLADPLSFLDELSSFGPEDRQRIMSDNLKALLAPTQ